MVVMAGGLLFLPFAVNMAHVPAPDAAVAPAVLVLFAVSIGIPFFSLSANAPLLQIWFSRTGTKMRRTRIFSTASAMSAACWRCCPIRS